MTVYNKYINTDMKQTVTFIDKTFAGEFNPNELYIFVSNDHYSLIEEKTSKNEGKKDKHTRKRQLKFDFETRPIDPLCSTDELYIDQEHTTKVQKFKILDSICSIAYSETLCNSSSNEIVKRTFTTNHQKTSARQFLDWLKSEDRKQRHYKYGAHFGSIFDNLICLGAVTRAEIENCQPRYRGLSIISMKIYGHVFKDTSLFLTQSLD